jgi:probable HAF family extracellular repeat protein
MAHRFAPSLLSGQALAAMAALAVMACDSPTRSLAPETAPSASRAGISDYTVTDIGTLGGWYSYAVNLNDRGVVIGISATATGGERAFVWIPDDASGTGTMHDLGTLPGWYHSAAYGINNHGDISGQVVNEEGTLALPVRWNRLPSGDYAIEALEHLGGHKGAGDAINNRGDVAGADCPPGLKSHIMIWSKQGNRNLGDMGGVAAIAYDINDPGQLAVNHYPTKDPLYSVAYLWSEQGGFRPIGDLGGTGPQDGTFAYALNNHAEIAGFGSTPASVYHAFLWSDGGGMEDLGTLGGRDSYAYDINGGGEVVGESETANGLYHGFVWSRGQGMRDIGGLVEDGYSWAGATNGSGLIVGGSDTPNGEFHAVLWTRRGEEEVGETAVSSSGPTLSVVKVRPGGRAERPTMQKVRSRMLERE